MKRDHPDRKGNIYDVTLCLCAKLAAFLDKEGKSALEISIVIFGLDDCECIWIEGEYRIGKEDALYKPFKEYFMKKLENILFND